MITSNYTYLDFKSILEITWTLKSSFGENSLSIIVFTLFVLFIIFIAVPYIIITLKYIREEKQKSQKKLLLAQILLKKEIEDEVEKEIHIDPDYTKK